MSLPPLPESLALFTPTEKLNVRLNWIVREYGELCRKQALEEAVKACEAIEHEHLQTYKHKPGPNAYDPHFQGLSMGASECAEKIGELIK